MELNKLQRALKEVQDELSIRIRVYPKWITEGRITAEKAAEKLKNMEDAVFYLSAIHQVMGGVEEYEKEQ